MTFGKVTGAVLALVAAFALGVWTGPSLMDAVDRTAVVDTERPSAGAETRAAASTRRAPVRRDEAPAIELAASEPDVHRQLKPVMNLGTKMEIASEGFRDAEQFATVAHAARNTKVPFMVLKHRVLEERKSLAAAIAESKPDLDAAAEARRARVEARESLAEVKQARDLAESEQARRPRG